LGLLGMRERLEMVGGKFSVTSAPGKGTTVRAEIPLADARAARAGEGGRNSRPKPRGTKS
jgi:signal transduction histidine kinase